MNIKGIKNIMAVAFLGVATLCLTACDNDSSILGDLCILTTLTHSNPPRLTMMVF